MTNGKMIRVGWVALSLLTALTFSAAALACPGGGRGGRGGDDGGGGGGGGEEGNRRPPPVEALNACNGAAENQVCQFESPFGSVAGTCRQIQNEMACVPEGGPPSDRQGEIPQGV
jgi:hypothetical protein